MHIVVDTATPARPAPAPRSFNPWSGLGDLPAEAWILFAATLVNRAGTMVLPFLALYVTEHLGHPAQQAGLALTIYGAGSLVSAPVGGRLSDRLGPVRVMQWSLLVSGALLLAMPFARALPSVLALVLLWSFFGEALRPASLAALADIVPAERRTAAFALNRLAIHLGMSIGPAVGGFLAAASFPLLFAIDGVTSIAAALLLMVWALPRARAERPANGRQAGAGAAVLFRSPRALAFLTGVLLVGIVFFQSEATLPLFIVRDMELPTSFYGLLFLVNTGLIILFEVPLNLAMAGWPYRRTLALGALLLGVGFGATAFAMDRTGIVLTVMIWTFGEMILFPVTAAYVADLAPADRRGAYMGVYRTVFGLAFMVGPWAGTVFMERYGAFALWVAVGACALCAAAIFSLASAGRAGVHGS